MEQRNNLVLQGTETFSRGQLDNLALENGALVLDSGAGRSRRARLTGAETVAMNIILSGKTEKHSLKILQKYLSL